MVFDGAAQHGLLPLAQRARLQSNGATAILSGTSGVNDRVAIAARYLHMLHHFQRILQKLNSAGVTVIALKGPLLAETIYPDPLLRPFNDLDILCHEQDWASAHDVLVELEFTLVEGTPLPPAKPWRQKAFYHNQYFDQRTNIAVELHFDLWQLGFFPRTEETIWKRAITISIAGFEVQSLPLEHQIIHLCVHLQHHSYRRLIWFIDLALLLQRRKDDIDWDRLVKIARTEELTLPVYYSFHYLAQFFAVTPPDATMSSLKPGMFRAWLHDRIWEPDRVVGLGIGRDISLQWREVPVTNELLYSLLVLGHIKETIAYLSRLLIPPGKWLARYYGTDDPSILRRRRLVHAPKMMFAAIRSLVNTLSSGAPLPARDEHIV